MLYTTYFSKMRDVPEGYTKLIITRFLPKGFDVFKYPNTYTATSLAPSKELLLEYKTNNDWNWYVKKFYEEMEYREDMVKMLGRLSKVLQNGRNICLVCYEKDYTKCHRSLIGQYFEEEGIEWKEL